MEIDVRGWRADEALRDDNASPEQPHCPGHRFDLRCHAPEYVAHVWVYGDRVLNCGEKSLFELANCNKELELGALGLLYYRLLQLMERVTPGIEVILGVPAQIVGEITGRLAERTVAAHASM